MKTIIKQMISSAIFIIAGLFFFAIGSGMTLRQRILENQGLAVQGVVVNLRENYDDGSTTYTPIVKFTTNGGQNIEFISSYSSSPPAYEIGEYVTVVYQPDNPPKAIIKGEGQFLHILFMLLGGIITLVGFFKVFPGIRNMALIQPGEL